MLVSQGCTSGGTRMELNPDVQRALFELPARCANAFSICHRVM